MGRDIRRKGEQGLGVNMASKLLEFRRIGQFNDRMNTSTDKSASAGAPQGWTPRIHPASKAPLNSPTPRKILLVDDDKIILKTTSAKLKAAGYEVLTAEEGGSAIRQVRQLQPHLIILDLNFPPDVGHGGGIPW